MVERDLIIGRASYFFFFFSLFRSERSATMSLVNAVAAKRLRSLFAVEVNSLPMKQSDLFMMPSALREEQGSRARVLLLEEERLRWR